MKFTLSICLFMISAGVCGALPLQRRHSPIDGNALEHRGLPGVDSIGLSSATGVLKDLAGGLLKRDEKLVGPAFESLPPTKGDIHLSTSERAVSERQVDPTSALAAVEGLTGVGNGPIKRQLTDIVTTVEGLTGGLGGGLVKRQLTDIVTPVEGLTGGLGTGSL
ncbi:hypothetical protein PILCRDRAFT_817139 [Piloderma croceum F 1598]|uniref:Uncharacterized protein n=1 Tax=Piloderma croceum (strain F 1598) TaxID=765440 RepID=A0A0C3G3K3_PILCF|nr:hypothetical protein PILCRDRAFT_817139 [Piloderma croceum F 1598]